MIYPKLAMGALYYIGSIRLGDKRIDNVHLMVGREKPVGNNRTYTAVFTLTTTATGGLPILPAESYKNNPILWLMDNANRGIEGQPATLRLVVQQKMLQSFHQEASAPELVTSVFTDVAQGAGRRVVHLSGKVPVRTAHSVRRSPWVLLADNLYSFNLSLDCVEGGIFTCGTNASATPDRMSLFTNFPAAGGIGFSLSLSDMNVGAGQWKELKMEFQQALEPQKVALRQHPAGHSQDRPVSGFGMYKHHTLPRGASDASGKSSGESRRESSVDIMNRYKAYEAARFEKLKVQASALTLSTDSVSRSKSSISIDAASIDAASQGSSDSTSRELLKTRLKKARYHVWFRVDGGVGLSVNLQVDSHSTTNSVTLSYSFRSIQGEESPNNYEVPNDGESFFLWMLRNKNSSYGSLPVSLTATMTIPVGTKVETLQVKTSITSPLAIAPLFEKEVSISELLFLDVLQRLKQLPPLFQPSQVGSGFGIMRGRSVQYHFGSRCSYDGMDGIFRGKSRSVALFLQKEEVLADDRKVDTIWTKHPGQVNFFQRMLAIKPVITRATSPYEQDTEAPYPDNLLKTSTLSSDGLGRQGMHSGSIYFSRSRSRSCSVRSHAGNPIRSHNQKSIPILYRDRFGSEHGLKGRPRGYTSSML